MVHLRPEMCAKARDLWHRKNGRLSIEPERIVFKERIPMALKNKIKPGSNRSGEKACMQEMMELMACMSKFSGDQSMCSNEVKLFNNCFSDFRQAQAAKKALDAKGVIPTGPNATLTGVQMNKYIQQFPLSGRTTQQYIDPKFKH